MTDINCCPMCGSKAILDSTGASEMYGKAWQYLFITCSHNLDVHCAMDLALTADFMEIDSAKEILITAWNSLKPNKPCQKQ